jgi:antitoxin VapB
VVKGRTFRSGNSEAIRLPKGIGYGEETEVTMIRSGEVITICPTKISIAEMLRRLEALPDRHGVEERDVEQIPERPGL